MLDAVLPPVVRRQSADDYERWRARNPDARPWIRTATWQVPLAWFVLVTDDEREYLTDADGPGSGAGDGPGDGEPGPGEGRRRCCVTARRWCRRGGGWRVA